MRSFFVNSGGVAAQLASPTAGAVFEEPAPGAACCPAGRWISWAPSSRPQPRGPGRTLPMRPGPSSASSCKSSRWCTRNSSCLTWRNHQPHTRFRRVIRSPSKCSSSPQVRQPPRCDAHEGGGGGFAAAERRTRGTPGGGALAEASRRTGMSEEDVLDLALARSAWKSIVTVRYGAGHVRLRWSKTPLPALENLGELSHADAFDSADRARIFLDDSAPTARRWHFHCDQPLHRGETRQLSPDHEVPG